MVTTKYVDPNSFCRWDLNTKQACLIIRYCVEEYLRLKIKCTDLDKKANILS